MGTFLFWVGVAVVGGLLVTLALDPAETRRKLARTVRLILKKLTRDVSPRCPTCGRAGQVMRHSYELELDQAFGHDPPVWVEVARYYCPHCRDTWQRKEPDY